MAKALYRQYRPQKFDDVLGQDRVVNVLKNQVKSSQISHAYLFAGERGCGKTTCAKIFAKAINCLNPKDGSPCDECKNCKTIDEESSMDVVEMDAASNRRIDDIRNLKETVIYPPNSLKYKVYIIDEAHMITKEAFNALLKIMEEPPSHLIFILATTEIEKIPKTILSRVQQFEFNKIEKDSIIKQIDIILDDYGINMEDKAKELIVSKANGAMRDALSILDQVLSIDVKGFTIGEVESILGVVDSESISNLLDNIIALNQKDSLEILFRLRANNKDDIEILESLIAYLRDIMVYKISENAKNLYSTDNIDDIGQKAKNISTEKIIAYLEILNDYQNRMKYSDNTFILLEMLVLRLINLKDENNLESRIVNLEKQSPNNIDYINKLVEKKLANLNHIGSFNSHNDFSEEKIEDKTFDKKTLASEKIDSKKTTNTSKNIKNESKEKEEDKENNLLSSSQVESLKKQISKCSPLLGAFIKSEPFTYDIIDDKFVIYYREDSYYQFLESSKEKIEKFLKDLLAKKLIVEIVPIDKRNSTNNNNDDEGSLKDVIDNLEDLFGDELIIEK